VDESEFQKLLVNRGIVIVHFSHHAVMGHSVEFPDDLQHAIAQYQSETRSCCALSPGHCMETPGSVGIIFRPTFEQVVSVLSDDSGSSDFGGSENSGGHTPSEQTILASLDVPAGRYNEWRVRGARPIGIFVTDTGNICAKKKVRIPFDSGLINCIGCISIPLSSVIDSFPTLPIYTLWTSGLGRIPANGV